MTQTVEMFLFIVLTVVAFCVAGGYTLWSTFGGSSRSARNARARLRFRGRVYVTPFLDNDRMMYGYDLLVFDRRRMTFVGYMQYLPEDHTRLTGHNEWMAKHFGSQEYYDFLRAWVEAEYRDKDAAKVEREEAKKFATTKHKVG